MGNVLDKQALPRLRNMLTTVLSYIRRVGGAENHMYFDSVARGKGECALIWK